MPNNEPPNNLQGSLPAESKRSEAKSKESKSKDADMESFNSNKPTKGVPSPVETDK